LPFSPSVPVIIISLIKLLIPNKVAEYVGKKTIIANLLYLAVKAPIAGGQKPNIALDRSYLLY